MSSCSLEKLQIAGFRSFGPLDDDAQAINFADFARDPATGQVRSFIFVFLVTNAFIN